MDWTTVGNAGSAYDPSTGFGAVGYSYQIGKYEVTNAQYVEFLNAKAASDSLGLYDTDMSSSPMGGIARSGSSGNYNYSVKSGYANMPVVYVSWYDAIRFANWMNNGQGSGGTESGAYTILGGTEIPSNGLSIARDAGATVFLTSENEWYKAAYHQPASAGGDSDGYWLYPTRTNTQPNSDQPPGDPSIQSNVANFFRNDGLPNSYNMGFAATGADSFSSSQNYLTGAGAYTESPSYYGTFDQGGNVWAWNETRVLGNNFPGIRGASWIDPSDSLRADNRYRFLSEPSLEFNYVGFRLASVPEPGSGIIFLTLGAVAAGCTRR